MRNVYLLFSPFGDIKIRRFVMPLGLLVVAGSIRKSPHFGKDDRIHICDTFREVLARAEAHKSDRLHFMVSAIGAFRGIGRPSNPAIDAVKKLKRRHPKIVSCVGGPAVALYREDFLPHFDLVFQGEIGSLDLLEVLRSGGRFFQAPTADMDAEPLDYGILAGKKFLTASLQTARGCPYDCAFCNIGHIFGRGARSIRPETLDARLEALAKVHTGFVIIADDSFAGAQEDRMRAFLDVMIRFQRRRGYPFLFGLQTPVRTSRRPEILRLMREANIVAAYLGIESPSEDALTEAGKKHNLEEPLAEQVDAFARNGIAPYLSLILGLDREPPDIAARLRGFLDTAGSPFLMLALITPLPGTRVRAMAEAENRLLNHPLYMEDFLISMKTDRPYLDVMRDYGDVLTWFFSTRRLFSYCDRMRDRIAEMRDPEVLGAFLKHVRPSVFVKAVVLYIGLCLQAGAWIGLAGLFRLIGKPKAEVFDHLIIRGVAVGGKAGYRKILRRVKKGLGRLRAAGLYPFENETNPGNIKNIT